MKLKLLDTGYVSSKIALGGQAQYNSSDRAGYDGTSTVYSFELNTENMTLSEGGHIDGSPIINELNPHDSRTVSSNNPIFKISVILHKTLVTTNHEYNNLDTLRRFRYTKGLKLLYPSHTNDPNLVEGLGVRNKGIFHSATPSDNSGTIASTLPYFVGIVKNFNFVDTNTDQWRITFDFEVTGQ